MEDSDDKVKRLPVRFKTPDPPELTLVERHYGKCMHGRFENAQYIVDESLAEIECSVCHEKLNPIWAMAQLARMEHRFHEAQKRYIEEMRRLSERTRTKCKSCGVMTPISRN